MMARPRAGSPAAPVSGAGMASPTISYRARGGSPAIGRSALVAENHRMQASAAAPRHSAEYFRGECSEPAIGDACLCGARRRRRIERADASRPRNLDELTVTRLIYA